MITKLQSPIVSTNPEALHGIRQQQYNQESTLADNRNYILLTTCLFEAIVNDSSYKLLPRDILFFLQIVSLYQLELSKGNTSITYPSLKLAKLLGVDASYDSTSVGSNTPSSANMRATILRMTAKLESLGLLQVFRRKRSNGMDMTNKLVPVLPDKLHTRLKDLPSNLKVNDSSKLDHESNLEHILRTKLFVPIELDFMKSLFKNNLPSKYKLFFLNCIMSAYRNFKLNSNICFTQDSNSRAGEDINSVFCDSRGNFIDLTNKLSFSATSSELVKKNNISKRTLFNIFKYIKQQGDSFFLQVEHKYTKSDDIDSNRYDKSIFVISINPLVFPISQIKSQKEEITEFDHDIFEDTNSSIFPDTYRGFREGVQKKQLSSAKKTALNNKEEIIKNKYSRNIDYIDENCEEEFLEEELCSSSSKSYNNSSFLDVSFNAFSKSSILKKKGNREVVKTKSTHRNVSEQKAHQQIQQDAEKEALPSNKKNTKQAALVKPRFTSEVSEHLELRQFYPLSEKDVDMLNSRAHREFSNNFVNQLLLKLYIKYPEKRFKNRFTFLSYMAQILKHEHHQGPRVNNPSFRFSCNISTNEHNILESERYLTEIENSFDTNKEMQVRKKIVGLFENIKAYEILLNSDFSYVDGIFKLTFRKKVEITMLQQEIIKNTIKSVYGNKVNIQITTVTNNKFHQKFTKKTEGVIDESKSLSLNLSSTVWHQIRKGLIEELGESIDAVWFSKAVAKESKETKTLTLTMPTRFMADWIRNNYSHVIRGLADSTGIKMVEYRF